LTSRRSLVAFVLCFSVLHAILAAAGYVAVVAAAKQSLPVARWADEILIFADVPIYLRHANTVFTGKVPYRDAPIEYPILALPFLYFPRLFTADQRLYVLGFALEMLLIHTATLLLVTRRLDGRNPAPVVLGRLLWYTACIAAVGPFLLGRYDAVPAFFGFAAACAWFSGRSGWGGLLAGLGTLVKIAPGVVALPGMIFDWVHRPRSRFRGITVTVVTVVVGVGVWFAVGGRNGTLDAIRYHAGRGLEVESIAAGLAYAVDSMRGETPTTAFDHASISLTSPTATAILPFVVPVQALALLAVGFQFWRRGAAEPMRYAAAAMLVYAIGGKVFSPQYLLWVLPFLAVTGGRVGLWARGLMVLACVATAVVCPWTFRALADLKPAAMAALNFRNALLVGTLIWIVVGPRGEAYSPEAGSAAPAVP
jgi:hypothetical protein